MDDVEVRASEVHGRGVFALRPFERGEAILPLDDSRVVTPDRPLDPSAGEFEHHCDWLGEQVVLMQPPERYINHSCEPNTYVETRPDGARWVVAYRDITAGDEITYDYCIDSEGDTVWSCDCGHPKCRQIHTADFFDLPDHKLAEYIPLLNPWFVERHQQRIEEVRRELRRHGFDVGDAPVRASPPSPQLDSQRFRRIRSRGSERGDPTAKAAHNAQASSCEPTTPRVAGGHGALNSSAMF